MVKHSRSASLAVAVTLVAAAARVGAASVAVSAASAEAAPGSQIEIPIRVAGAQGLGPLQLVLRYDPALLAPLSPAVQAGPAAGGAMVETNQTEPGVLRIAMISGQPVTGDGVLLRARFDVTGDPGQSCELGLGEVRAWDHQYNLEMLVSTEAGQLSIAAAGLSRELVIAALIAALLFFLAVAARRTRRRPC